MEEEAELQAQVEMLHVNQVDQVDLTQSPPVDLTQSPPVDLTQSQSPNNHTQISPNVPEGSHWSIDRRELEREQFPERDSQGPYLTPARPTDVFSGNSQYFRTVHGWLELTMCV